MLLSGDLTARSSSQTASSTPTARFAPTAPTSSTLSTLARDFALVKRLPRTKDAPSLWSCSRSECRALPLTFVDQVADLPLSLSQIRRRSQRGRVEAQPALLHRQSYSPDEQPIPGLIQARCIISTFTITSPCILVEEQNLTSSLLESFPVSRRPLNSTSPASARRSRCRNLHPPSSNWRLPS